MDGKSVFIPITERRYRVFVDDAKCTFPDSEAAAIFCPATSCRLEAGILPCTHFTSLTPVRCASPQGAGLLPPPTGMTALPATDSKTYGELCGVAEEQTSQQVHRRLQCLLAGQVYKRVCRLAARIDRNWNFRYGYMDTAATCTGTCLRAVV